MEPYLEKNYRLGWDSLGARVKEAFPEVDLAKIPFERVMLPISDDEAEEEEDGTEEGEALPEGPEAAEQQEVVPGETEQPTTESTELPAVVDLEPPVTEQSEHPTPEAPST